MLLSVGEPKDYTRYPRYSELEADEAAFCARTHISPADYLAIREKVCFRSLFFLFEMRMFCHSVLFCFWLSCEALPHVNVCVVSVCA